MERTGASAAGPDSGRWGNGVFSVSAHRPPHPTVGGSDISRGVGATRTCSRSRALPSPDPRPRDERTGDDHDVSRGHTSGAAERGAAGRHRRPGGVVPPPGSRLAAEVEEREAEGRRTAGRVAPKLEPAREAIGGDRLARRGPLARLADRLPQLPVAHLHVDVGEAAGQVPADVPARFRTPIPPSSTSWADVPFPRRHGTVARCRSR